MIGWPADGRTYRVGEEVGNRDASHLKILNIQPAAECSIMCSSIACPLHIPGARTSVCAYSTEHFGH